MKDKIKVALMAATLGVMISSTAIYQLATQEDYIVTVMDKERVVTSEDSYYLVFTEDKVFKNDDTIFHWKFDSSAIQGKIQLGSKYKISTYGWRVPFLSMYENITEVTPYGN